MSSEKNAQEYYEELDKRDKKERLGDKAVAKSIRRNERKNVNEGFEGAIEILEEVINEVSERTKIDAYKKRVAQHQELADRETKIANDYAKLGAYEPAINHLKKASDSQKKEFKHRLNTISHDKKFGQDAFNKAQKELYDEWKAKNNVKEGFEDTIELLEEVINEVSDKTAQGALDKAKERYNRKGYEASMKLFQGDSKGAIEDGNKAQDEYNKHINMQLRRAKRQGKKLVQDKNDHDSFKIEEAMELMEDIRSAIEKKHGKPEYYSGRSPWQVGREPANKSAKLTQKANEIKEKEALQAAERELDKDRPDLKGVHPAKKNSKIADYYGQIMARRNGKAPLKEAQELLEEIINEVSLKKWKESAKNSYDKRKEVADKSAEADKKSWDNYEKQSKLSPEDEPELFKKAVDQGAIAYKDKKERITLWEFTLILLIVNILQLNIIKLF